MIQNEAATSAAVERWRRMEAIFHAVIDIPESGRAEFLVESCGGDEGLHAELQDLLLAFESEKGFRLHAPGAAPTGRLGETVGGYCLDAEIGQGGMGTVYLAHRADGEFERQVALKVVSSHLRTRFFTERFRAERQILAGLNHPHITRLLDGGVSAAGDPYLVMEYVEGQPIDRYCDERLLTVPDRIRLFLQACSAIEYAHRKLVVHRDLKPANLLVTADGVPKLLDFGTAKLLLPAAVDSAGTLLRAMTPRYASPEQLRGEPVSTSMDVYALGVMLYELLAGAWPFGDPGSAMAGFERALRDIEPAHPATRITEESARLRSSSKAKLASVLRGDLRSILAKAMEPDPQRRYSSVEHLSADLQRYLHGEPVLARPGTPFYRARKFVRRHRLAVSAAVSFAAVLAAAAVYSFLQAEAARREAEKAQLVTRFLQGVLSTADPTGEGGNKNMTVLDALDRARRNLDQLDAQPQVKGYLHYTLGTILLDLSDYDNAEEQLRNALAMARKAGADDDDLGWAEAALSTVLRRDGKRWGEVEDLCRDALAHARKQGLRADPALFDTAEGQYAVALWKRHGHSPQVEALAMEADGLARTSPAIPRAWLVIADTELAQYLMEENRDAEAAKLLAEALARERSFAHPTSALGAVLATLGSLRAKQGDFAGAERFDRQYRDEMLREYGPNHAASFEALAIWSVAAARLGHASEAERASKEAVDTARRMFPAGGPMLWRALLSRAWVLNGQGRFEEAEALARASLDSWPVTVANDPQRAQSQGEIGVALAGEKRFAEAVPVLESSQRALLTIPGWGPGHPATLRVQKAPAAARAGLGRE